MKLTRLGASWVASVSLHALMMGALGWAVAAHTWTRAPTPIAVAPEPSPAPDDLVGVELPSAFEGSEVEEGITVADGVPPTPSGGETIARVDTGNVGKGGGPTSARAIHMADRDEGEIMTPDLPSRLDRDQIQRIETSRTRASWEDRRATTEPMELTFLAFGSGDTQERRPKAERDPSRGAMRARPASVIGGPRGGPLPDDAAAQAGRCGGPSAGSLSASPGVGKRSARAGQDHRLGASLATGKPDVQRAAVSIPATDKDKPRDTIDTTQEVSQMVQSIVHASATGGAPGFGIGGSEGGASPGAGGHGGAGSHPAPLGGGLGDYFDLDTSDPRLLPYFRKIRAKVNPLWSFPKSAALDGKTGLVILEVTIAEDGTATVKWPPLRPSGIDEFDRNCADAFRKAQPFDPIPRALGIKELRIRAPFNSTSPASWAP
jgi:TonB family protein